LLLCLRLNLLPLLLILATHLLGSSGIDEWVGVVLGIGLDDRDDGGEDRLDFGRTGFGRGRWS
jgi:hypothetical protein